MIPRPPRSTRTDTLCPYTTLFRAEGLEVVDTLPSGPDPELLVISPDGTRLYVANEDDNMVTVVDLKSGEAIAEIPVGVEPEGMGVRPDGKTIVNTSETTNMAPFIDAETSEIRGNVLVDKRPPIPVFTPAGPREIGRAWCRDRGGPYVKIPVVG